MIMLFITGFYPHSIFYEISDNKFDSFTSDTLYNLQMMTPTL